MSKAMLDLDKMKTHHADKPKRFNVALSTEAHDKLRAASRYTGVTMSELVETLIHTYVPDHRAPEADRYDS